MTPRPPHFCTSLSPRPIVDYPPPPYQIALVHTKMDDRMSTMRHRWLRSIADFVILQPSPEPLLYLPCTVCVGEGASSAKEIAIWLSRLCSNDQYPAISTTTASCWGPCEKEQCATGCDRYPPCGHQKKKSISNEDVFG